MIKSILTNISIGITYGIITFIISVFIMGFIYNKTSNVILTLALYLIVGGAIISFFINIFNWYLGGILLLVYILPFIIVLMFKRDHNPENHDSIEDNDIEYKLKH